MCIQESVVVLVGIVSVFLFEQLCGVVGGVLGGVRCAALFVSYHPIHRSHLRRASALSIDVCAGDQLARLKELLTRWISEGHL